MHLISRCSTVVRYRNFPVGTSTIFLGVAELSFKRQGLMRFMCRSRLYRDEKYSMHRSHQCRFPAIRSAVIRFKVHYTPVVGSSLVNLLSKYTPFDIPCTVKHHCYGWMHSQLHLHIQIWNTSHCTSALRCLGLERLFKLLRTIKCYLDMFQNFRVAVQ